MTQKNIIPVAFGTDENYAMPLTVTITSMLENADKSTFYDIYILIDTSFTENTKNIITSLEQRYSDNCKIDFIYLQDQFDTITLDDRYHFTKAMFFRFMLASLLPNYDKCIYLDCDIIVQKDLLELFNTDIENYYIAGVRGPGVIIGFGEDYAKKLNIPTIDQYINTGVLLMNLKELRNDNIESALIDLAFKKSFLYPDQDIFNIICYNKIKHLELRFNLITRLIKIDITNKSITIKGSLSKCFPHEEIIDSIKNNTILHFASEVKPWNDKEITYSEYWWKYFDLSPYKDNNV